PRCPTRRGPRRRADRTGSAPSYPLRRSPLCFARPACGWCHSLLDGLGLCLVEVRRAHRFIDDAQGLVDVHSHVSLIVRHGYSAACRVDRSSSSRRRMAAHCSLFCSMISAQTRTCPAAYSSVHPNLSCSASTSCSVNSATESSSSRTSKIRSSAHVTCDWTRSKYSFFSFID